MMGLQLNHVSKRRPWGEGLLYLDSLISPLEIYLILLKYLIDPMNHTHIWQVSPQLTPINPQRTGTELSRFNKVNIMAADALAPYVARTSAAMILTI